MYVKARYYNHSGQLKTCNQGYSAMAMNRLNKHQKLDQAKKSSPYRRILEKEALMYIMGVVCVKTVGIQSVSVIGKYLPSLRSMF